MAVGGLGLPEPLAAQIDSTVGGVQIGSPVDDVARCYAYVKQGLV